MATVYIVLGITAGDNSDVLGTFSTLQKAANFRDQHRINGECFDGTMYDTYYIVPSEIDRVPGY